MTTITLEFDAAEGLSITAAKLFAVGSDVQVATAAATERANAKGKYTAAYTDLAAGTYIVHAFDDDGLVALSDPITTLASTGTYRAKTLDDVTGGEGGGQVTGFSAEALAQLRPTGIFYRSPIKAGKKVTITQGDDCPRAVGRAFEFELVGPPYGADDVDQVELVLSSGEVAKLTTGDAEEAETEGNVVLFAEPVSADTAELPATESGEWLMRSIVGGAVLTEVRGPLEVLPRLIAPASD